MKFKQIGIGNFSPDYYDYWFKYFENLNPLYVCVHRIGYFAILELVAVN
jgi:hypothetical protein